MRMNRTNALTMIAGGFVAATAAYACSSSSSGSSAGPPLNDAGNDHTTTSSSGTSSSGGTASSSGSGSSSGTASSSGGSSSGEGGSPDGGPAPACSSLPGTVVYIESGDTQEPLLKTLGRQLRDEANVTIAFMLTGSCTLSPALYQATPIPKNTNMLYIPSTAENPSWTTADAENTCTTDPNNGTTPNLGISALFPSSCAGLSGGPPTGVKQWNGPIQAYTFIVPSAEFTGGQTAISAAEAYYAFGDGANNQVTYNGAKEWNDPTQFFLRPATKSTLVATALNIGLTPAEMTLSLADGGTSDGRHLESSSTQVLTAVETATGSQTIGILGDEVYDANRGKGASVLAFSAFGETSGAWYPDSSTSSFDKQNIRNGNYTLWSPTVYIAPVDGSGNPSNPAVKYITDLVLGNPNPTPPNGLVDGGTAIDGLGDIVSVGLTPNCAMQVERSGDGQPLTPYPPAAPCTCYFLSKVPQAAALPASCTTCTSSAQCPANVGCFNGYCEAAPTNVTSTPVNKTGVVLPPPAADGGLEPVNP
jgi:hypothetical protein